MDSGDAVLSDPADRERFDALNATLHDVPAPSNGVALSGNKTLD
jgi:hypothetical protein